MLMQKVSINPPRMNLLHLGFSMETLFYPTILSTTFLRHFYMMAGNTGPAIVQICSQPGSRSFSSMYCT
jgi:hypothetical protein